MTDGRRLKTEFFGQTQRESADEVRSTEMDAQQVGPAAKRRATCGGHPVSGDGSRKWAARPDLVGGRPLGGERTTYPPRPGRGAGPCRATKSRLTGLKAGLLNRSNRSRASSAPTKSGLTGFSPAPSRGSSRGRGMHWNNRIAGQAVSRVGIQADDR